MWLVKNHFVITACSAIFVFQIVQAQIVQPDLRQSSLDASDVIATPVNTKEADAIRKEIQDAVSHNKFIVKSQHLNKNNISFGDEGLVHKSDNISSLPPAKNAVNLTAVPLKESDEIQLQENPGIQPDDFVDAKKEKFSGNVEVNVKKPKDIVEMQSPGQNPPTEDVDEYFQHEFRLRELISSMVGSVSKMDPVDLFETSDWQHSRTSDNNVDNNPEGELFPNVVHSQIFNHNDDGSSNPEISPFILNDFDSRETSAEFLEVKSFEEDINFTVDEVVDSWKAVESQHGEQIVLAGIIASNITVFLKSKGTFQRVQTVILDKNIVSVELFTQWNTTTERLEEVMLVALNDRVIAFKVGTNYMLHEWYYGKNITGMKYYKSKETSFLAILSSSSNNISTSSIAIYQVDLNKDYFWLSQIIPLEHPISEVAFIDTGRDIVLAVPQKNYSVIFAYNPNMDSQARFQNISIVASDGVQSIQGFQMGGFSYLAISGFEPKILRYHRGQFFPQTILGQSFQFVERFLPVPARTYRDDLILLIQHRIFFETHDLVVVEALIWDGQAFQSAPSIPCLINNATFAFGLSCVVDVEGDDGIDGAVVLSNSREIRILVPQKNSPSRSFQIYINLIENHIELELYNIYSHLKKMVMLNRSVVSQAEEAIERGVMLSRLNSESLQVPEFFFAGEIGHIFVNNQEWFEEDATINITNFLDLLEETEKQIQMLEKGNDAYNIVEKDDYLNLRTKRQLSENIVELDHILIENLFVERINGVPLEEIMFIKNGILTYNGTVEVDGDILTDQTSEFSHSEKNVLNAGTFEIDGELKVEKISGLPWRDFLNGVVLVNIRDEIDELDLKGDAFVDNSLEIDTLNELKFPDEYLLSSGPNVIEVSGVKRFHTTLTVSTLDIRQDINGVHPRDVMTLSGNQYIQGVTTISDLEVAKMLEVDDEISGVDINHLTPNLNLLDTNIVESSCEFNELEVNGPINVKGFFDSENLDFLLNDVVYQSDENVSISSIKGFKEMVFEGALEVEEGIINDVHLDDFVTKDTEQLLDISSIAGEVYFNTINLIGLFDTVNITELEENTINIRQEVDTEGELKFNNSNWFKAETLQVQESLNGGSVDELRTVYNELILIAGNFEGAAVNLLQAKCDIEGPGILNDVNMTKLDSSRLSLSQDQVIIGDIVVNELELESDAFVEILNNISTNSLLNTVRKLNDIPAMIQRGEVRIGRFNVFGSVDAETLNGLNFKNDIIGRVVWLNRPNFISKHIRFLDPVIVDNHFVVHGDFNGQKLQQLLDDIIFKSTTKIAISNEATFLKYVDVRLHAELATWNGIPVNEIMMKNSPIIFRNSVDIFGELVVEVLQITQFINDYNIKNLPHLLSYDGHMEMFFVPRTISFTSHTFIDSLHIRGNTSGVESFNYVLESLVLKTKPATVTGRKIFTGVIEFRKDITIEFLNEFSLTELLDNVICIDGLNEVQVDSLVSFSTPVSARSAMIEKGLHTSNLMGCFLAEWEDNGLRTDLSQDIEATFNFNRGALDGNYCNVFSLNGHYMADVITFHTPQNISSPLRFSEVFVFGDLAVYGTVNGIEFVEGVENTLRISGNQHITTSTSMQSARVLENLETLIPFGGVHLSNVVTLLGDIYLRSPLSFKSFITKNIVSNDLVSGLNFSIWYQNALWVSGRKTQVVIGNWNVESMFISECIQGTGIVNNILVDSIKAQAKSHNAESPVYFKEIEQRESSLCYNVRNLAMGTGKQVYFLKYFENTFQFLEDGPVDKLMTFTHGDQSYIMTNVFCYSNIYKWRGNEFEKVNGMMTGSVANALPIETKDGGLLLVISSKSNNDDCNVSGVNIWEFAADQLNFVKSYKNMGENIHHSPNWPHVFFGVDEGKKLVMEVDLLSNETISWQLPSNFANDFYFLPYNIDLGVALTNGQELHVIKGNQSEKRRRRRFINVGNIELNAPDFLKRNNSHDHSNFSEKTRSWKDELAANWKMLLYKFKLCLNDLIENLRKYLGSNNYGKLEDLLISEGSVILAEDEFKTKSIFKNCSEYSKQQNREISAENKKLAFLIIQKLYIAALQIKDIHLAQLSNIEVENLTKFREEFSDELNFGTLSYERIIETLSKSLCTILNHYEGRTNNITKSQIESVVEDLQLELNHLEKLSMETKLKNENKNKRTTSIENVIEDLFKGKANANQFTEEELIAAFFADEEEDYMVSETNSMYEVDEHSQYSQSERSDFNKTHQVLNKLIEDLSKLNMAANPETDGYDNLKVEEMLQRIKIASTNGGREDAVVNNYNKNAQLAIHVALKIHRAISDVEEISKSNKLLGTVATEIGERPGVTFDSVLSLLNNNLNAIGIFFINRNGKMLSSHINSNDRKLPVLREQVHAIVEQLHSELNKLEEMQQLAQKNAEHSQYQPKIVVNAALQNTGEFDNFDDRLKTGNQSNVNNFDVSERVKHILTGFLEDVRTLNIEKADFKENEYKMLMLTITEAFNKIYAITYQNFSHSTDSHLRSNLPQKNYEIVGGAQQITSDGVITLIKNRLNDLHSIFLMRKNFVFNAQPDQNINANMKFEPESDQDFKEKISSIMKDLWIGLKDLEYISEITNRIKDANAEVMNEKLQVTNFPQASKERLMERSIVKAWSPRHGGVHEFDIPNKILDVEPLVVSSKYFPSRSSGEVLTLTVGSSRIRKKLVAVTSYHDNLIIGHHDSIHLYSDIEQGHLFQTIQSFKPRSLTAMHLKDETVLAFVEGTYLIRIFVYRGIEGFVEFKSFRVEQPISILTTITLPSSCSKHFLIVASVNRVQFFETIMGGQCGINISLNCSSLSQG